MNADGRLVPSLLRSSRVWATQPPSIIACGCRSTPRMTARPFGSRGSSTCLTRALGYPNAYFLFLSYLAHHRARPGWLCLSVRRYTASMTRSKSAFYFKPEKKTEIDITAICVGNTEFWMTVHDYVKLSRRSPTIDILFPRFCSFFGTTTILRRYQMICDTWYVASRCEPGAIFTRDRPMIMRRKAPRDPMRHLLYHQKLRT